MKELLKSLQTEFKRIKQKEESILSYNIEHQNDIEAKDLVNINKGRLEELAARKISLGILIYKLKKMI